jgi:23S rRNA pseudouridine2605 synthase
MKESAGIARSCRDWMAVEDGRERPIVPATNAFIHERMQDKRHSSQNVSGERIAKVIARAGVCSRREAEAWIAAERVAVNGAVIASPALNLGADDSVTIDGAPLPGRERTRLFLYHKPRALVTTHADPQGRPTIFGALPKHLPRLLSVGRLDINTEGLLLLTNDGGLARVLELPATGWLRRYRVRVHGTVHADALARLHGGITIDGVRYGSIEASLDRAQGANAWLTFAIREGKNREVKNVLGHLGLKVARLIRVSFGPFQLGELGVGEVAEVPTRVLREQLGERVAAAAGADFSGPIAAPPSPISARPRAGGDSGATGSERAALGPRLRGDERIKAKRPAKSTEAARASRHGKVNEARRRSDAEKLGEPELARRERRRGFRPQRGKRR